MVHVGMFMSDDPVADAERYDDALEEQYARSNVCAVCDHCGKCCGAEDHYDVFGAIACSKECAKALLTEEDVDTIIDEWLDDNVIPAHHEYDVQYR